MGEEFRTPYLSEPQPSPVQTTLKKKKSIPSNNNISLAMGWTTNADLTVCVHTKLLFVLTFVKRLLLCFRGFKTEDQGLWIKMAQLTVY